MKKIGKYGAVSFKRMLSVILVIALLAGNSGADSIAAQTVADEAESTAAAVLTEDTAEEITEGESPEAMIEEPAEEAIEEPAEEPKKVSVEEVVEEPDALSNDGTTNEGLSTSINFGAYQNSGLDIYNYLYYTSANSNITLSGGSYAISGDNESQGIVIGNHPTEAADGNTNPLDADISVSLTGLTMTKGMTIKPVGSENANKVVLTVGQASSLGALMVEDNARLELVLDADLSADSITLGENSTLTVTGSGTLTVSGDFTSRGTVTLSGGNILAAHGISALNLSLNGATVNGNGNAVAATETLSMENGMVENASLFGYAVDGSADDGVQEIKTLTLSGSNTFANVSAVGCARDSGTRVSIEGINTVSSSTATTYYCDYMITYRSGSTDITPQNGWPAVYRVSSGSADFNNAAICGYHTDSGFTADTRIPLPEDFNQPGYEYQGWKLKDSEEIVTEITVAQGNITLSAVLTAGEVTVKLDRGYVPDQYTNDKDADGKFPERTSMIESVLDGTVTLPVPDRFGYKFAGWKVTSGTNQRELTSSEGTELSYTVALADCAIEGEQSVVTMEALWTADTFNITLFLGSNVQEDDNLLISVDGGKTFQKFKELGQSSTPEGVDAVSGATSSADIIVSGRSIQFSTNWPITYGQSISEYLRGIFKEMPEGTLPILKDGSAAGTAQTFSGWSNASGTIDGTTKFLYGEGGMLTPGNKKLTEYQKNLHTNNAAVNAVWDVMSYDLTFSGNRADGKVSVGGVEKDNVWTILVDGEEVSAAESGTISVPHGSTVTLRTYAASPLNFCLWNVMETAGGNKILPIEREYHAGDAYLEYDFVMPAANVTAGYGVGDQLWVNIFDSPITFAEGVTYNGRTLNGFWYDEPMVYQEYEGMKVNALTYWFQDSTSGKYFYIWDFADKFYVTSCDQSTENQLHIVNSIEVILKHCHLACREAYLQECVEDLVAGNEMNRNYGNYATGVNYEPYANILVDLSENNKYKATITLEGDNYIGVIATDHLYRESAYVGELIVQGRGKDKTALTLGTLFSSMTTRINNMTLKECQDSRSDYLAYFNGCYNTGNESFQNLTVDAESKWLVDGRNSVSIYNCKDFRVGNIYFLWISMNQSNVRVKGDIVTSIHGPSASSSTVVVDGNVIYTNLSNGQTSISNSTFIVKGTVCDLHGGNISGNSFVIANIVAVDAGIGVSGNSVVVANMLTASVHDAVKWDSEANRYTLKDVKVTGSIHHIYDGNEEPFVTYTEHSHSNAGAYTNKYYFLGNSATYLLGYYRTKPVSLNGKALKIYDLSITALEDDNNPVKSLMEGMLDENGGYNGQKPGKEILRSAVEKAAESYTDPVECITFGDTHYPTDEARWKYVSIKENAGLYAAGNITFFNDTSVLGGTIVCAGTFSTKRDLTVTGGSIQATEIGNSYQLTKQEGAAFRWQKATFENCTLKSDRIGALSREFYSKPSRSTVTIGENVNVQNLTDNSTVRLVDDIYVNYFYDENIFDLTDSVLPDNLRFESQMESGTGDMDGLKLEAAQTFAAPKVKDGGEGQWRYALLSGYPVGSVGQTGYCNDDPSQDLVYHLNQLSLYAVKTEYTLKIAEGTEQLLEITSGEPPLELQLLPDGSCPVKADETVTLTLSDKSWTEKTVIWYRDAAGVIHNVENFKAEGTKVSFKMPACDAEVFITNELKIYLDLHPISFTENGFAVEEPGADRRQDSVFTYGGNFLVTQLKTNQTDHRMFFETAEAGNVNSDGGVSRTITLKKINQFSSGLLNGMDLTDGAKVEILLDGENYLTPIRVPEHAEFVIKGKTGASADILNPRTYSSIPSAAYSILYSDGVLGKASIQDICLTKKTSSYIKIFNSNLTSINPVSLINVKGPEAGYSFSHYDELARNTQSILIDGCDLYFYNLLNPMFLNCGSLEVKNSKIKCRYGSNNGYNLFYGLAGAADITDSTVEFCLNGRERTDFCYESIALTGNVTLKGNSVLKVDHRLTVKELHLEGQSRVTVGEEGETGYLFCPVISVKDEAGVDTDYLFVSGFNTQGFTDAASLMQSMASGNGILDGQDYSGLVMNGGTVTAREFAGGDVSGKITVNGGRLEAARIGTLGKLCGYPKRIPKLDETTFAYFYEKIPKKAEVNINGGEVNVENYLGGMHAEVNISGGKVNLGEDAILGLTGEQQTTLYNYATENHLTPENFGALTITGGKVEGVVNEAAGKGGSIQVPYGTVNISGAETGIRVYNLMAYCGEMTISGVTGDYYKNPYTGSDMIAGHEKLGVHVVNRLSARNLTITRGSVVYASYAYANVPKDETGRLTVTIEENDRGYLYTGKAYGVIGEGDVDYVYNDGTTGMEGPKNVFGTKVVDVHYIIQPRDVFLSEDLGKEKNPNMDSENGLPYYVVTNAEAGDNRYYTLQDASCSGYRFLGWYEYDPDTKQFVNDTKVTQIDKTNSKDIYLGARWEKVQVTFEVQIRLKDQSEFNRETMSVVDEEAGLYRFNQTATVAYGDQIRTEKGVLLANYTTNTLGILEIAYHGTIIQKSDRVTPQMADAFVNGDGSPLVLMVTEQGTQTEKLLIALDQNKNDRNRPEDTKFNLKDGTLNSGSNAGNHVDVYEVITTTLGSIRPFADDTQSDGLIHPTAPGYTFGGWYTDRECSDDRKVSSDTTLKSLHDAHTSTLYAKWIPNTYLVQFCAATGEDETGFTDNRWVTADDSAPAADLPTKQSMDYYWVYDTAPKDNADLAEGAKGSFWVQGTGDTREYKDTLPCAWREGYVFEGWQFTDSTGKVHTITSKNELNKATVESLNEENYVGKPDSGTQAPALTLYASYRPVEVTYDLNGGKWMTESAPASQPAYGTALAGYSEESRIASDITENTDYFKSGTVTGADGTTKYSVLSTSSSYFANHSNKYVSGDYRESLSRKGYTFQGWRKAGDDTSFYGCTPRFEDINLTAEWTPNVYDLKLYVKDDEYKKADNTDKYVSAFSNPTPSTVEITGVTVESPISADKQTWPDKEQWYAYNKKDEDASDDTKHRFMLGVTFAGLDPGDSDDTEAGSVYLGYADAVTNMLNSKTMFENGDTFFLPEDEAYQKDLEQATVTRPIMSQVPDYPTGSEIPMYGVYRERSLVFIEKYVDSNGAAQSRVMYSHPWSQYTNYPYDTYPTDTNGNYTDLTTGGYALAGWYVGSDTIDASREYTEDNFKTNFEKWKSDATKINSFDINVYTAYVAQQTIEQTLTANAEPTAAALSSVSYTLPGSMQEGELNYQLSELTSGLHLVSKEMMQEHQYDSKWSEGITIYTADNTVAIELKLEKDGATPCIIDLTDAGKQELGNSQYIGKDWKITLTLYHSRVMTKEAEYSFDIDYTFKKMNGDVNTLKDQWLKDKVTVKLTPSLYNVEYWVNLPEAEEQLTLTQPENSFAKVENENAYQCTVKQGYNSELLAAAQTLMLEGYDRENHWSYVYSSDGTDTKTPLTNLTLESISGLSDTSKAEELKDGRITVYAGYLAKEYKLVKDRDNTIPDGAWTVTYGEGAEKPDHLTTLETTEADVKYHSKIIFTPGSNQPAEYITLTFTDSKGNVTAKRLDQYAKEENGSYTFDMPAKDVTISYSQVLELYLDNGTIELFPDGFKQVDNPKYGNQKITWPGDYRILQDENDNNDFHPTANVLKLSGDLTRRIDGTNEVRTIRLGNLNITSDNSVELINSDVDGEIQTTVNLTQEGNMNAKNILVPEKTSLTVAGAYKKNDADTSKTISLAPGTDRAAIGATAADGVNGSITLSNVDVSMKLNAPSVSSSIGSGKQDSTKTYGAVTIADSWITVVESSSASGQYTGAWIGGAGVADVNISNTFVTNGKDSDNHGARAVDGKTVDLINCQIGDNTNPVKEPIHAADTLKITDCQIYQSNTYSLGAVSMIGTDDSGNTTITNSVVQVGYSGNGKTDKLFTGQMVIEDAKSDVTIDGTQIIEVSHGDIEITGTGVNQTGQTHSHSGLNYLLLEERDLPADAPNVAVKYLGDNKTVTVQQPVQPSDVSAVKDVTIGALDIQDDAKLILKGNLIVTDNASVAGDQTFTVESVRDEITYEKGLSGDGNYIQTGGGLIGHNDVVVRGNMTLTNVNAECKNYAVGSNGGSAPVMGADGAVKTPGTTTTVAINGGSITAALIGAVGVQNDTFTFVEIEGNPTIKGKLVQDHYRLKYEVNGIDVELKDESRNNLPTVLRTETPYSEDGVAGEAVVYDGKPANPTGQDAGQFLCWYIWSEDGKNRLGLLKEGDSLPAGLKEKTLLAGDTKSSRMSQPAEDGTCTLSVYAWLKVTGKAAIKQGRLFRNFTDGGSSATVSGRGAWTAILESNGTHMTGRDYQVTFENALPAGTDLTLTVITGGVNSYYHFTLKEEKTAVKFSEFTQMGTTERVPPQLTDSDAEKEIFLLSADFGELGDNAVPTGGDVSFSIIPENGTTAMDLGDGARVSYTVTSVVSGVIAADTSAVTVNTPPSGEEKRTGKTVYMVGTLSQKADEEKSALKVPLAAMASLTASGTDEKISGQWISSDTVAFPLGIYGSVTANMGYKFSFENLSAGEYSITWRLCTGETPNMLNGVCSNEATSQMIIAVRTQPMLEVTSEADSRVLAQGTEHEMQFNYTTTAESFTVTVEKQSVLANFNQVAGTMPETVMTVKAEGAIEAADKVTATVPAEAGTYRVRFSMDENSANDDVYYTFIVE